MYQALKSCIVNKFLYCYSPCNYCDLGIYPSLDI